jgi:MFS transporter, DHA3 family, macrolide efflux protein
MTPQQPTSLLTFIIIWFGQVVSTIGTYMTDFAIALWVWQLTSSASALTLVAFFSQILRIPTTVFAGIIVDRFNRKNLMILGDSIAAISTIALLALYLTHNLQIWHLYFTGAINGCFRQIQDLAYEASLTQIIPKQHYARATSMGSVVHYGPVILAPAFAGSLYPLIGLAGILLIDIFSFIVAIITLFLIAIPQPPQTKTENQALANLFTDITFGFRYLLTNRSLRNFLLAISLFWFAHDFAESVGDPMILARSNSNPTVLASISAAAGISGVMGAIILSIWGGPKRRIYGMLLGFIGAGASKTAFGLGRNLSVWIPAQFCSSLNFPLMDSCETAIWLAKVPPHLQGRVFAAKSLMSQLLSSFATLITGLLADKVLEPAVILKGGIFGSGKGTGISFLYVMGAACMLLVGLFGFIFPSLRNIEKILPDSDEVTLQQK